MNTPSPVALRLGRLKLLLIVGVFLAPVLVAAVLTLTGWQPRGRGNGMPVLPQRNLLAEHVAVILGDGAEWPWRDREPRMTLLALPGPDCAARCFAALTGMTKAYLMLNHNQPRLRLLYVGVPPADPARDQAMRRYWTLGRERGRALDAYRAGAPDSVAALLVESNGTVLSRYPAGFDVAGLAQDLQKVIR